MFASSESSNLELIRPWHAIVAAIVVACLCTMTAAAEPKAAAADQTSAAEKPSADEAAIRQTADAYETAFAAGDAKTLAAQWVEDGELVDEFGRTFKGRDEIEREFTQIFADRPGATVDITIDSVKFLSPDVAVEQGSARAQAKDGSVGDGTQYTAVHVKRDGKWLLANVNESRTAQTAAGDKLADLNWLVGEWKADLGEGKTYRLRCDWMADKTFLRREFSVQEGDKTLSSGTQIIGVDPVLGQIVSWTFDSSGGFGHEMWERQNGRWRIAASSVLSEGGTSLSTNYLTKVDDNAFTWQSVERSLNDQLLPDTAQVRVERVSQ
jgi:uncharacterized protein (TIGR02246 family)